ncbi:virion structural protein [Sulfitobacter phage phiCB2047-B]|uniref:F5/8 type C domain-containing protein n=1 Tax=Sulfitobacter phage phiCB2047-B TaxID=754046 RepID=M4PMW2_9CAUD|nr:virion structural protein [Sulfitobacter phage phiCB2047-B]AGH07442.1 hypothetical protein SUFG_00075 [Sulfitobacter phage phiCB2047-B]
MPHPIDYNGTQDDDQIRSIDLVHIEPSIREGLNVIPSLYGKRTSRPLRRYPPVIVTEPYITGSALIPSTLFCHTGQWDASPAVQFAFQWMADGTDISGATLQTWTSSIEYDGKEITCEVRGYNTKGEAYLISTNSITVSIIEPIEINDADWGAVSGISQHALTTVNNTKNVIVTGIGTENAQTVVRSVAYFFTGRSADKREDVNSMYNPVITGLSIQDSDLISNSNTMVVSKKLIQSLEIEPVQQLNIKNPNADMGNAAWTTFGPIEYIVNAHSGDYYNRAWFGGTNVDAAQQNFPYTYQYQDVPVEELWETDIDTGLCNIQILWYQSANASGGDAANMKVEFYDETKNNLLGFDDGAGLVGFPVNIYLRRNFHATVPVGTRYIRVFMEFLLVEGQNNNALLDTISGLIYKGNLPSSRSFGPAFEMWRLNFTRLNSAPYISLKEIEFRDDQGVDQALDGRVISGSEGMGGYAVNAFDDLRDNQYWASENSGIADGTAWIGYDFGTPTEVSEIDITARNGTNAHHIGREFILQGSDDGQFWYDVQVFDDIETFSSDQQKQFNVLQGVMPWTVVGENDPPLGTVLPNYVYKTNESEKHIGNIYTAKRRMNIKEISAMVLNGAYGEIGIARIATTGDRWFIDNEFGELEVHSYTATSTGRYEVTLDKDFEVEVGDLFAVIYTQLNTSTREKIYFDTNYLEGTLNNEAYDMLMKWRSSSETIVENLENLSYNNTRTSMLEVKGTYF